MAQKIRCTTDSKRAIALGGEVLTSHNNPVEAALSLTGEGPWWSIGKSLARTAVLLPRREECAALGRAAHSKRDT